MQTNHTCPNLVSVHQTAPPLSVSSDSSHLIAAYYYFYSTRHDLLMLPLCGVVLRWFPPSLLWRQHVLDSVFIVCSVSQSSELQGSCLFILYKTDRADKIKEHEKCTFMRTWTTHNQSATRQRLMSNDSSTAPRKSVTTRLRLNAVKTSNSNCSGRDRDTVWLYQVAACRIY